MIEVCVYPDFQKTAIAAGKKFARALKEYKGKPVLLLLSGGSSLEILHYADRRLLSPDSALGVLDERITPDKNDQNAVHIRRIWPHKTFLFPRQTGDVTNIAKEYEENLKMWLTRHPEQMIVVIQGIGTDGHTAGIFPGFNFSAPDALVAGYDIRIRPGSHGQSGGTKFPFRVTITNTFLRMADMSFVYACGAEKKEAIIRTLASSGDLSGTPARIIHEMKSVILFTDQQVVQ